MLIYNIVYTDVKDGVMMIEEIKKLKEEKDALILAHNYQRPEVIDIADFVGDSFYLSQVAKGSDKSTIVFCGVDFMAESAKILSPEKKILLPVKDAGCPLAEMVDIDELKNLKKNIQMQPLYAISIQVQRSRPFAMLL